MKDPRLSAEHSARDGSGSLPMAGPCGRVEHADAFG
jgi:hypothetical protein